MQCKEDDWVLTATRHRCLDATLYPSKKTPTLGDCQRFCRNNNAKRLTYNLNQEHFMDTNANCACCSSSSELDSFDAGGVYTFTGDHTFRFATRRFLSLLVYIYMGFVQYFDFRGAFLRT